MMIYVVAVLGALAMLLSRPVPVVLPAAAPGVLVVMPESVKWAQYHQQAKDAAKAEFDRLYANVDPVKVKARMEFDRLAGI